MVEVETYKGCNIELWSNGQFEAKDKDGKRVASASTLLEVKQKIDRYVKEKSRFPRTEAIYVENDMEVRLNSRDVENADYVWISYIDPVTPTEKSRRGGIYKERPNWKRSKEPLTYGWSYHDEKGKAKFVLLTDHNKAVLKKILNLQRQIKELQGYVKESREEYTDPVTYEFLEKLVEGDDNAS